MPSCHARGAFHKPFSALCRTLGDLRAECLLADDDAGSHQGVTETLQSTIDAAENTAIGLLHAHGAGGLQLISLAVESLSLRILSMLPDRPSERFSSPRFTPALWLKADPAYIDLAVDKGFTPGKHLGKALDALAERATNDRIGADRIARTICDRIVAVDGCDIWSAMEVTLSPYLAMVLRTLINSGSEKVRKKISVDAQLATKANELDSLAALHLAGFDLTQAFAANTELREPTRRLGKLLSSNHGQLQLRQATGSLEDFMAHQDRYSLMYEFLS